MSNIVPPQLLSVGQAAKALNIGERTLFSISAPRGPLPVVRIGNRVLYDMADIARYIESQKTTGGAQ
ncbi:MAG TPA: helix-turn-helix domain-containing protein [Gemmataceae bacterium]|nr:helix-turn-helix domain-containing protein [Gemmataceae bacterium]